MLQTQNANGKVCSAFFLLNISKYNRSETMLIHLVLIMKYSAFFFAQESAR